MQVLLDELGMYPNFITPLRIKYLQPIASLLYPDWSAGGLDSHKAFIVKYEMGQDESLSYHFDNAEVTINVCLNDQFEEGSLYIGPMRFTRTVEPRFTEYKHELGRGVFHRGQQMHGATPISEGQRYNLIVWMRASSVRNKLCPMCDEPPKLVPSAAFGDGFTDSQQGGWCSSS